MKARLPYGALAADANNMTHIVTRVAMMEYACRAFDGDPVAWRSLLMAYKQELARSVDKRVRLECSAQWQGELRDALSVAGSPAQSWYLTSQSSRDLVAHSVSSVVLALRIEVEMFDRRGVPKTAYSPIWMSAYFGDEPGLTDQARPVSDSQNLPALRASLETAHELLGQVWGEAYPQVEMTLCRVIPYQGRRPGFSGCTPLAYGAIFLSCPESDPHRLACTLVHESSHHWLHVCRTVGRFTEESDQELLYSPFRREYRPLIGVLHSAFALGVTLKVLELFQQIPSGQQPSWLHAHALDTRAMLSATISVLRPIHWTPLGHRLWLALLRSERNG